MERFDVAAEIIQEAGKILRRCHLEQTEISQKTGHQDLVTFWDRKIEQQLRHSNPDSVSTGLHCGRGNIRRRKTVTGKLLGIWTPLTGRRNFINQHQNLCDLHGVLGGKYPLFGLVLDVERKDACTGARHGGGAWQKSDADPHLRPAGAFGIVADNAGPAIHLFGTPSLPGSG